MFDKLKDLGGLMQQAQQMQQKMKELQDQLEQLDQSLDLWPVHRPDCGTPALPLSGWRRGTLPVITA